jgi:DNA mismatch repair protein MutS
MASGAVKSAADRRLTPMMRQYMQAKAEHPDALLMFRMGDFFEMFFEDAQTAAKELEIVLTARDKDRDGGPIPMAGVPHHAVSSYIARLVERGYTVAICDQVEDPKKAKGLVRREVTRLITPGTQSDLDALDPAASSYVAHVDPAGDGWTVGLLELLAGELLVTHCDRESLADELRRMGAREVLVEQEAREAVAAMLDDELPLRSLDEPAPSDAQARAVLEARFASERIDGLAGGGGETERRAVARLIRFAETTQRRKLEHLMAPRAYRIADWLVVDEATRRNLELVRTQIEGRRTGSLLWHLDRCRTAIGSRRLGHWLVFPLRNREAIEERLDAVELLAKARDLREEVRRVLDAVRDIERLLGRVAVGRACPRDLGALSASLACVPGLRELLAGRPSTLGRSWQTIDDVGELRELLDRALVEEPPMSPADGGIFKRGYRDDLDALISLSTEGHDFLADLEQRERERTGIAKLKVRYNKVFGYYIEVTKANIGQVPDDYVRKQTLVGAERYITEELKQFEVKVLSADEKRKEREQELFEELVGVVAGATARIRAVARLVAETDALAALAQVADEERYARPTLCDEPVIDLEASRHPVLERLMPGGERFVPNDVQLDADSRQLVIVTGPNMAGKSTVMRQVGLITLMAHIGSFVPAKRARIGLCDRLFTRVGAADNLGRGQSTFMVEMVETAAILRHATRSSLVLLDEIGRGTSTFDGVSIAWAVGEYLHDHVGCRTMFATHYHELTDLALERPRAVNASVAVEEHDDEIVFLRRLVDGAANRSYGIEVARLAALPDAVLGRAREVLANLEAGELDERGMPSIGWTRGDANAGSQLDLFGRAQPEPSEVERRLSEIDLDSMTPLDALNALDRLKKLL